jgi:serine-type D-Ala-D-Ala carboxypeptidase/endopeptidase (penicillin-binding protein 4)
VTGRAGVTHHVRMTALPRRRTVPSAGSAVRVLAVLAGAACVAATALVAPPATASPGAPPAPSAESAAAEARVAALMPRRLADRRLGSTVGVAVVDAETGRPVYSRRGERRLLPASNMKIVTATTVLTALGPGHRFTTSVVREPGGADLVLVGGGDPLLTTTDLTGLARDTARAYLAAPAPTALRPGARPRVVVRIDDSLFGRPTRGPGWTSGYMPYSAAPVRGLARLGDYSWDTGTNAGKVFARALRGEGLRVRYAGGTTAPGDAETLARFRDHTVDDAVHLMLQVSENNVAEVLFRHVGLAESGNPSWRSSSRAAAAVLGRLGIDTTRLRLKDGSGLSRADRLTPNALAAILSLAVRPDLPRLASIYAERGLPTAGRSGTLAPGYGRYTTKPSRCARGKVLAKTGTLYDTITLSGIATGADGRPKAFSFLVNDRPQYVAALSTRQALDGLAATVVGCW